MSRSLSKGPFVADHLIKKVMAQKGQPNPKPIKTWARSSTVIPDMIGLKFQIHNGKIFHEVLIEENMVGHKLGEFSPTRIFKGHSGKLAKAASEKK
jgi:small subunit ribosomal protein S19